MLFRRICGIDLGTDTIKICDKNEKLSVCEKNMIAIRNKVNVIAIGQNAFDIYEKAPSNIDAGSPMQNGAIADVKNLEIVLTRLLRRFSTFLSRHPDVIMAIPSSTSELEKMAYYQILTGSIKSKRVALIEKGLADAVGIGMPVTHPMGNMVVNIGASTTEITVVSEGKIIISRKLELGGNHLDKEIISMIRKQYHLNIGLKTAEQLKNNLANAVQAEVTQMRVFGIHTVTGLPVSMVISSNDIYAAISATIAAITSAVKTTLERTPPQLIADIQKNGIYLSGGVSQIPNLADYVGKRLEVPTFAVPNPVSSILRGLVQVMNVPELRKQLTFTVRELSGNTK